MRLIHMLGNLVLDRRAELLRKGSASAELYGAKGLGDPIVNLMGE